MPYQTGGEAMVSSLLHHNIKTLFALPGVQNDWFFNALYDMNQNIGLRLNLPFQFSRLLQLIADEPQLTGYLAVP